MYMYMHIHRYSAGLAAWFLIQIINANLYSTGSDQFGSALGVSDDTLVITCPGYNSNQGAVDIWKLSTGGIYQVCM